jgi:hypothetical protein
VLELAVKTGCRSICEVPIVFGARHRGDSKMSLPEQLNYVRHLLKLYTFRFPYLLPTVIFAVAAVVIGATFLV